VQAMDNWGRTVFQLAFAHTASSADAEDVYQEVFIRLLKDTTPFKDDEHLKAWLLRVAINCCHDLSRLGWHRRVTTAEEMEACDYEANTPSLEVMQELAEAMGKLPEDMRVAVHLYYYEGYTSEDIAQMLDTNASTVRTRLERARKQLKTLLGGAGNGSKEYL